jgi:predicted nucleotidyltransferase
VRVFSLDRPRIAEALRELVEARYRLDPRVVSVYLFGSFAWGMPAPGSDLDLLVIVDDDPRPARDRIPDYLPGAFPIGVDVLVWTRAEWEERLAEGDRLARQVATQGRMLLTKPA